MQGRFFSFLKTANTAVQDKAKQALLQAQQAAQKAQVVAQDALKAVPAPPPTTLATIAAATAAPSPSKDQGDSVPNQAEQAQATTPAEQKEKAAEAEIGKEKEKEKEKEREKEKEGTGSDVVVGDMGSGVTVQSKEEGPGSVVKSDGDTASTSSTSASAAAATTTTTTTTSTSSSSGSLGSSGGLSTPVKKQPSLPSIGFPAIFSPSGLVAAANAASSVATTAANKTAGLFSSATAKDITAISLTTFNQLIDTSTIPPDLISGVNLLAGRELLDHNRVKAGEIRAGHQRIGAMIDDVEAKYPLIMSRRKTEINAFQALHKELLTLPTIMNTLSQMRTRVVNIMTKCQALEEEATKWNENVAAAEFNAWKGIQLNEVAKYQKLKQIQLAEQEQEYIKIQARKEADEKRLHQLHLQHERQAELLKQRQQQPQSQLKQQQPLLAHAEESTAAPAPAPAATGITLPSLDQFLPAPPTQSSESALEQVTLEQDNAALEALFSKAGGVSSSPFPPGTPTIGDPQPKEEDDQPAPKILPVIDEPDNV
ncbi:hypothetical protein Pelo_4144 [Pelomyxa schiedti]|nr:hypothetical protein Pelo_4144 [Pelomyxa schiedti]